MMTIFVIHNLSSAILKMPSCQGGDRRMSDEAYGATVAKRRLSRRS